jgi:8-oxo-dGTP pyrophosphatase MutT (NUDIX family)
MTRDWSQRLAGAVSPLDAGVSPLAVNGLGPSLTPAQRPARTAAVLVPILDLPEPEVVLTTRADHLPHHPGQVSFPGGRAERNGETAVETALREAFEEIGLAPSHVRPIGFLDRLDTISDYRVLPVVGLVSPVPSWRPDPSEVAEVFTVPLSVALDAQRYTCRTLERGGASHRIWSLEWEGRNIWGVTAAMLVNLRERLDTPGSLAPCGTTS